jgi:hypothetical protein
MLALMETQTQVHVSFAEVKERLLAIKTPSADTVEQILDRIQALLTLLKTFEEVYPEQYRTQMIGVTLTPKELPDEEENFIDSKFQKCMLCSSDVSRLRRWDSF